MTSLLSTNKILEIILPYLTHAKEDVRNSALKVLIDV